MNNIAKIIRTKSKENGTTHGQANDVQAALALLLYTHSGIQTPRGNEQAVVTALVCTKIYFYSIPVHSVAMVFFQFCCHCQCNKLPGTTQRSHLRNYL